MFMLSAGGWLGDVSGRHVILVTGIVIGCGPLDKSRPGRWSGKHLVRRTVSYPWGGSRRPLRLDCGRRPFHQPSAIPDRLIGRLQPTLVLDTRTEGKRRIPALALPGRDRRSLS